jgi:hypothetical protein
MEKKAKMGPGMPYRRLFLTDYTEVRKRTLRFAKLKGSTQSRRERGGIHATSTGLAARSGQTGLLY